MNKYQDLAKFTVPDGFRGKSSIYVQIWWATQSTLVALSPQPLYGWRNMIYRFFGAEIGRNVKIRQSARITYPWKVKIGDNTWIGDRAELYSLDGIAIGSNVCISQDAYLCTGSHDSTSIDFRYDCRPINIEDEAWIASGTFVAPGVTIGRGTVVGARSLVLKSLPGGGIYAGQPAKLIRERPPSRSGSTLP